MRVLHLTSSFPRWPGDVVAPWLFELARAEAATGMDVHVLAPHDRGLPHLERWGGVEVRRFRYGPAGMERLAYRGGMLSAARSARAVLVPSMLGAFGAAASLAARRLRPDVIHAHWWFPAGVAAAAASAASGVPWVLTLHGSDVYLAGRPRWAPPARAVLGRAGAVVAVSTALAAEAAQVLGVPVSRIGVAPMPVPVPAPALLATPMPFAPPLRLVFVGRLVLEKGLDVLLGAVALLVERGIDVQLVVVGSGPLEAKLRAQAARARLGDHVSWVGAVSPSEVGRYLVAAHALVAPSRREGLGMVALEALAHGRPVVASRVGGLVEVVRDGADGLLVDPGDEGVLADALMRLPLRSPAGEALGGHRLSAVASEHLRLYASLVSPQLKPETYSS
jgi:glycosyltransferase involved in cell wall biosynthesis